MTRGGKRPGAGRPRGSTVGRVDTKQIRASIAAARKLERLAHETGCSVRETLDRQLGVSAPQELQR